MVQSRLLDYGMIILLRHLVNFVLNQANMMHAHKVVILIQLTKNGENIKEYVVLVVHVGDLFITSSSIAGMNAFVNAFESYSQESLHYNRVIK